MYATNEFKKGLKIEVENIPYQIVEFQHVSPGKGSAFTRTRLKNLLNQNVIEKTFKSGDKVAAPNTEHAEMQYLYRDAGGCHFMNMASYDQTTIPEEILKDGLGFLQENMTVQVLYYNDRPIYVELPTFVALKVTRTDPAFKGDTVSGGSKPATLESGATVQVPFHISEGDVLKIDTRDGTYVEKVNK